MLGNINKICALFVVADAVQAEDDENGDTEHPDDLRREGYYKGLHFPSNITREGPPITRDCPPSLIILEGRSLTSQHPRRTGWLSPIGLSSSATCPRACVDVSPKKRWQSSLNLASSVFTILGVHTHGITCARPRARLYTTALAELRAATVGAARGAGRPTAPIGAGGRGEGVGVRGRALGGGCWAVILF